MVFDSLEVLVELWTTPIYQNMMMLVPNCIAYTLSYSPNDVSVVLKPLKCRYKARAPPLRCPPYTRVCAPKHGRKITFY